MTVARVTDMLGLLHKAPRTVGELAELTGMSEARVRIWIRALKDEGLVATVGTRDVRSPVAARIYVHELFAWRRSE